MSAPVDIEAAKAVVDGVTQSGPWTTTDEYTVIDADGLWVAEVGPAPGDAKFVAESITLLPALIAEVEVLRAALDESTRIARVALGRLSSIEHPADWHADMERIAALRKAGA
jgi:hypothetical protein